MCDVRPEKQLFRDLQEACTLCRSLAVSRLPERTLLRVGQALLELDRRILQTIMAPDCPEDTQGVLVQMWQTIADIDMSGLSGTDLLDMARRAGDRDLAETN